MEQKEAVILEGEDGYKLNIAYMNTDIISCDPKEIKKGMEEYKWVDGDVLICTAGKCGTHLIWEIVQMLLKDTACLTDMPKEVTMLDFNPVTEFSKYLESPKAINTHLRLDVLPDEFQNRKTITVIRNPKDVVVSFGAHFDQIANLVEKMNPSGRIMDGSLEKYINMMLQQQSERPDYWSFHSYMWKRRHDPHILILFYEDLVKNPLAEIEKVNEFLATNRSPELLEQISEATRFESMKKGKEKSERINEEITFTKAAQEAAETHQSHLKLYRKGRVGDWKNHLTVAQSERIDQYVAEWKLKHGLDDLHFTFE